MTNIVRNTETIGLWTEYIVCKVIGLEFKSSRLYIKDLEFKIQKELETKLEFLRHVGVKEHIGNANSDNGDFLMDNCNFLSIKSNITGDKVCPPKVGQTTLKKLNFKAVDDYKNWVLTNPSKCFKFYAENLLKSENCVYINYSKGKIFNIRKYLEIEVDNSRFSFTRDIPSWKESCTMKIDGVSVAEFQVHNNRKVVKCRFSMINFIKKFTEYEMVDFTPTIFKIVSNTRTFNYIGSKTNLLSFVGKTIESYTGSKLRDISSFFDIFAGTGVVSSYFIENGCKNVYTNDNMYYSYVLCSGMVCDVDVSEYIREMNNLKPVAGFIHDTYSNNRMYFTIENAMLIDSMRSYLETGREKFGEKVYFILLRELLYASSKVANISSTYGAYLKKYKASSIKKIEICCPVVDVVTSVLKNFNQDVLGLVKNGAVSGDVCYLDPPYNNRKYSSNYFVMECLAKYSKEPVSGGVTGVPISEPAGSGSFCSKSKASESFKILFENIKTRYVFMSYSSDSLLSSSEVVKLMTSCGWKNVVVYSEDYRKFKSSSKVSDTELCEYIIAGIRA